MITVYKTPSVFEMIFDYNPRIIADIKALPNNLRYWNGGKKCWCILASQESAVNLLLKKYNKENPTAMAPEQVGEIPPLPELTIDLGLKMNPFPYQAKGIAYSLLHKRVIVGDQPGLGKTLQAIGTMVGAKCKCILVICPSSLKLNWQREFEKVAGIKAATTQTAGGLWNGDGSSLILTDSIKTTWTTFHRTAGVRVFITNYESLKKYFVAKIKKVVDPETGKQKPLRLDHIEFHQNIQLFDAVILDELHKCKDGGTQQSKFCMGLTKGKDIVLGLTGTPVVNKPKDLISQLHILGRLGDFGGYKVFMDRYCGGNGTGATNLAELNYKLQTTCFFQRQKKEVLTELPDKMRQIVISDITTRSEYNDAISDLSNYLQEYRQKTDEEVAKSMRGEIMVKIGVCKNISARGKINDVIEHINEVVASGEKIGVFIHQREIAAALKKYYPDALTITGSDSQDARQAAVDNFQNNPACSIILLSIKAAGVGLTLTAASRCLFVELPWHAADCDQCEDRFHRIGQKDSVQCAYFLGKETIDEDIYEIIEKKRTIANTVTGTPDNVQKEIIDRVMNSLFNKKQREQSEN